MDTILTSDFRRKQLAARLIEPFSFNAILLRAAAARRHSRRAREKLHDSQIFIFEFVGSKIVMPDPDRE
jgi:hypothetical protein